MTDRRVILKAGLATAALVGIQRASAQPSAPSSPGPSRFSFDDVVRRARESAGQTYDGNLPSLPEAINNLDYDAWRDIRFKPDRSFFQNPGSRFRMQLFHLGFLYRHPVTINIIRDGIAAPIPYASNLFDYGKLKLERPLPVGLGFAGFRIHHQLNGPNAFDELISFLGASYFRFLSRGQHYGLSARGLAVNAGLKEPEEFPVFTSFWIDTPAPDVNQITVYALMQSESLTAAYQFIVFPGVETAVEVTAHLFIRKPIARLGVAPLTSMYFVGENDRRLRDDYRPELHDSDGLLMNTISGEWLWRPLRNPKEPANSVFIDNNIRGFGLMQRDRSFEHYQDLDLNYEKRPSYWIEPHDGWGEGAIELVELPTGDETNDNIVAFWRPKAPIEAGQTLTYRYRMTAPGTGEDLNPGGVTLNTFHTRAAALGSNEKISPGATRFIIDFGGGDLKFFLADPQSVQVVASASVGKITRSSIVPNPDIEGFRAMIDIEAPVGQVTDLRAFLKASGRVLTETWTYPWQAA